MAVSGACLGGQERLTVLLYDSVGMPTGEVEEAVDLGRVMACAMAHEILHSLGLEHAPFGIMRETIGEKELASFGRGPAMPGNQVEQLRSGAARLRPALMTEAQTGSR